MRRRTTSLIAALRGGDPQVTWLVQNSPLTVLVPLATWIAHGQGNLWLALLCWLTGGAVFNLVWFPYLRRNEHPPSGVSQSIAAATSTGGAFVTPDLWLLLGVFIAVGAVLVFEVGARGHATFQFACLVATTYFAVDAGLLAARVWVIFLPLILPLSLSAISFVSSVIALRESRLDSALTATGATAWDIENGVVSAQLGKPLSGIGVGTQLADRLHPDDERPTRPEPGASLEYRIRGSGASWRWIRETVEAASASPSGGIQRSGVVDITAERRIAEADRLRATTDQLTGLANRAAHIAEADSWATRGEGHLVLVDLDDFKQINDTLGHSIGDRVLQHVARRLAAVDQSAMTRLGGDEFACVVAGSAERAQEVAAALVEAASRPLTIDSMIVISGASAGVAPFVEGTSADEVRRQAGVALRVAKATGGSVACYDTAMETRSRQRQRLAQEIPGALAGREFVVYFQPKVDMKSDEVVGFEALVRWDHRDFGVLSPADFLDLIEVGGHFRSLYPIVLDQALGHLVSIFGPDTDRTVAVNVNARNLREPDLVAQTAAALEAHGLTPRHLLLELTEDALVSEDPTVAETLVKLDQVGIGLSIDDFGTGFSSLSYLSRLPVCEIKLDWSLVSQLAHSPRSRAVVEAVLGLADRLDIAVVAEGVEQQSTRLLLQEVGCRLAQGYLFGRPADPAQWAVNDKPLTARPGSFNQHLTR